MSSQLLLIPYTRVIFNNWYFLLTGLNTFQWPKSDASLGLIVQILLLQEVHVGDAQTVRILVVALIRIPFVLLHVAVA